MTTEKSPIKLTAEQDAFVKTLAPERRKAILELEPEDMLSTITSLMARSKASNVDLGIEFGEAGSLEANLKMLRPGIDFGAGDVISFELEGTLRKTTTDAEAESWDGWNKEEVAYTCPKTGESKKANYYYQDIYIGNDLQTGERIGFYSNVVMNRTFKKIRTLSAGKKAARNPRFLVEYVGKVEGLENLAKYDIVPTKGKTAHVFVLKMEKGISFNPYEKGCVNFLSNPLPNLDEKENLSATDQAMRDWAGMEEVISGPALTDGAGVEERPALS